MAPTGFQPPPRAPQAPLQPAKLADFTLAGTLGSGATAKVYEAVHVATGRNVAIKILEPSESGIEIRERFAREAVLLAGVSSRHVGSILGFGFERGQPFLVLERLVGETLDAKLRRDGPVPLALAMRWIEQLLLAVRDCHDQQIIHRDIKPANIFLHQEGLEETVKLIDFGVARLREITGEEGGLTSTNHLIGSMGYMAPEQFRNAKTVGFTADLYAIGVCIFRALTGRLPFVSRSLEAVIRMKAEQRAPPLSSMPGMPKNDLLDWFVKKSMAREPGDRFQSAREMLEHWWNVMAGLTGEDATDVVHGVGRFEEVYAEPSSGSTQDTGRDASTGDAPPSSQQEERTVRRFAPSSATATIIAVTPMAIDATPSAAADTLFDASPRTERSPDLAHGMETALADDPSDMPTRSHPNLRKLVERELELQRNRKR